LGGLGRKEILQLVEDCVQDALIAILEHLGEFRGDSRFTTWAYKFAINIALTRARHERWKNISLDELIEKATPFEWKLIDQAQNPDPDRFARQAEALEILRHIYQEELTQRQREALALIVFKEVPLDEVVQHFGSNRNAVYKLLHDARRKLKIGLEARGMHLTGDFAGEVAAYDKVHELALEMADFMSDGVIRQFPDKFRGGDD
jgi:RNA polymerase sigma-70 factor (ECF subfamily)